MREELGQLAKEAKGNSPYSQYHNVSTNVIDSPSHYIKGRKYEPIEVITD